MTSSTAPAIDTHVHFWDLAHDELTYGWLQAGVRHPILGDIEGIKHQRYDARHLWSEARFADIGGFVHVQAAVGTTDPVAETRWVDGMTGHLTVPLVHVAHTDLSDVATVEATLDRHGEYACFRGVRDFALEPALAAGEDAAFDHGFQLLAQRGLVLDLDCEWQHMAAAAAMARRNPDLVVVLEHLGYPRTREPEYFEGWKKGMTELATAPNVFCKISGIGMGDPRWTEASIREWVEHCLRAFGPDRCVLGSNWPVDRLFSSYDAILAAYRTTIGGLTEREQAAVLSENARHLYRL